MKVSEFFTWQEFCEVFAESTLLHTFNYNGIIFSIVKHDEYSEFWIDGEDAKTYQTHNSAQSLLDNIRIRNKTLQEIWADLD